MIDFKQAVLDGKPISKKMIDGEKAFDAKQLERTIKRALLPLLAAVMLMGVWLYNQEGDGVITKNYLDKSIMALSLIYIYLATVAGYILMAGIRFTTVGVVIVSMAAVAGYANSLVGIFVSSVGVSVAIMCVLTALSAIASPIIVSAQKRARRFEVYTDLIRLNTLKKTPLFNNYMATLNSVNRKITNAEAEAMLLIQEENNNTNTK